MIVKCKKCSMNENCICITNSDECDIRKESYNKAIEDIREKLLGNGFIFTEHALNVFDEIAEQLKS